MKKYEVILTNGEVGIFTGKKRPVEGQEVTVYCGEGVWCSGVVYDVVR